MRFDWPSRTVNLTVAATAAMLTATACSSIDLSKPSLKESQPPTCSVSASDYKLLSYWNKRTEDKKYASIIAALEKKYRGAPRVGESSAVVAAQSYVRQNANVAPLEMERKIEESCANK